MWTVDDLMNKEISAEAAYFKNYYRSLVEDFSTHADRKIAESKARDVLQLMVDSRNRTNHPYPDKVRPA